MLLANLLLVRFSAPKRDDHSQSTSDPHSARKLSVAFPEFKGDPAECSTPIRTSMHIHRKSIQG